MREGGVDPLGGSFGAEIGSVDGKGDGARFPAAEKQGRRRGGAGEAFGVAVRGRGEDSFGAGYGEDASGDCEGPDLEAELSWELWKERELGIGGGHCVARLRARDGEESDFVLRARLCCR